MESSLKKMWRVVGSRRFAIILLLVLAVLLMVGSIIPNLDTMLPDDKAAFETERPTTFAAVKALQVRNVTSHPLFLLWPLFLLLSVLQCTSARIRPFIALKNVGRQRATIPREKPADAEWMETGAAPDTLAQECEKRLNEDGWKVGKTQKNTTWFITGEKGRIGFWGSLGFHAGMLVVLGGVGISLLLSFHGAVLISEGQTLDMEHESSYLAIYDRPVIGEDMPSGKIILDKFNAGYNDHGEAISFALDMHTIDSEYETRPARVEVNRPLKLGGLRLSFRKYGFSPRFVVQNESGETILDAHIRLNILGPEETDSFVIPSNPPVDVDLRFFPDHYDDGGKLANRSLEPRNPAFLVYTADADEGRLLKKKGSITIDGFSIRFEDLRYYAYLEVYEDPAMGMMIAGFFIVVAGLTWRFRYHERKIMIRIEGPEPAKFALWGISNYFPTIFEEQLQNYRARLKEDIE